MEQHVLYQMCSGCGYSEHKEPEWENCPRCDAKMATSMGGVNELQDSDELPESQREVENHMGYQIRNPNQ